MIRMKTDEDFINRMNEKYPNEKWKPIEINYKSLEYSIIECGECGKQMRMQNCEIFRKTRKHICSDCIKELREDTKRNQDIILAYIENNCKQSIRDYSFDMKEQKNHIRAQILRFTCNKCNHVNERMVANILYNGKIDKLECSYCSGSKQLKNNDIYLQELEQNYPDKFELLSEYKTAIDKIRVRCKRCGFIRDVRALQLLRSGYCPKCDTKASKGEQHIAYYLQEHNINYVQQKYFKDWNIGIHYFDFYIPAYNLVLEYHGRQHYEYVDYFHHTVEEFEHRKEKDILKREEALKKGINYISINHKLHNHLDEILDKIFSSTTISKESRGKCLEIETIQDILDEDIVSTSGESQSSS